MAQAFTESVRVRCERPVAIVNHGEVGQPAGCRGVDREGQRSSIEGVNEVGADALGLTALVEGREVFAQGELDNLPCDQRLDGALFRIGICLLNLEPARGRPVERLLFLGPFELVLPNRSGAEV